jgi:hypothetical protein
MRRLQTKGGVMEKGLIEQMEEFGLALIKFNEENGLPLTEELKKLKERKEHENLQKND